MGVGVLLTAVFTLLTPLAANTNLGLLYTVRIIEGLGEGLFGRSSSCLDCPHHSKCHLSCYIRNDCPLGRTSGEKQVRIRLGLLNSINVIIP